MGESVRWGGRAECREEGAGRHPVGGDRKQGDGPGEESAVAAAGGFGEGGEPGRDRWGGEQGSEGAGVGIVVKKGYVARIEWDVRVAGGKEARVRGAGEVGPDDAGAVGRGAGGAEERPPRGGAAGVTALR